MIEMLKMNIMKKLQKKEELENFLIFSKNGSTYLKEIILTQLTIIATEKL